MGKSNSWEEKVRQNGREDEEIELCSPSSEELFGNLQPHVFTISSQKINPFQLLMKQT